MVRKCFQEKFDTFRINYIPLLLDVKVKKFLDLLKHWKPYFIS